MFKNKSYYHHNANDLFEFNLFSDFQLPFAHRSPFFCSIVMANILVVATSKVWWCDNKVLMIRQQISTCLSLTYRTESKVDTRSDWTQKGNLKSVNRQLHDNEAIFINEGYIFAMVCKVFAYQSHFLQWIAISLRIYIYRKNQ